MTDAAKSSPSTSSAAPGLAVEAHFLGIWATLLQAGAAEGELYGVLATEALSADFRELAKALKGSLDREEGLARCFEDSAREALIRPWVLRLLLALESPDTENPAGLLVRAAELLLEELDGRRREQLWAKLELLICAAGVHPSESLEAVARDAVRSGDGPLGRSLMAAARRSVKDSSATAALASCDALDPVETLLLRTAGETFDEALLARLRRVAALKHRATAEPKAPEPAAPVAPSAGARDDEPAERMRKALSGALNRAGELLGMKKDGAGPEQDRVGIPPRAGTAIRERRRERKVANETRRQDRTTVGGHNEAVVGVNTYKSRPKIRVKGREDEAAAPAVEPDPIVRKTIGPAWLADPAEADLAPAEDGPPADKTIGPASPSPDTPADSGADAGAVQGRIRITSRGSDPAPGRRDGKPTLDELRRWLIVLESESDPARITEIAETIETTIRGLRDGLRPDDDPDHLKLRRELDDLELAFGTWLDEYRELHGDA